VSAYIDRLTKKKGEKKRKKGSAPGDIAFIVQITKRKKILGLLMAKEGRRGKGLV